MTRISLTLIPAFVLIITALSAAMELESNFPVSGRALHLDAEGDYALVIDSDSGLLIIDVSNPALPSRTGKYPQGTDSMASVKIMADAAYIVFRDTGLMTLLIGNPASPLKTDAFSLSGFPFEEVSHGAQDIDIHGNMLAAQNGYIFLFDLTDPLHPSNISTKDPMIPVNGLALAGNALLCGFWNSLALFDPSDNFNPNVRTFTLSGFSNCLDVTIRDTLAFLACHESGMFIADINEPSAPTLISRANTGGQVLDIAVAGNLAFVAAGNLGVVSVDITDPSQPVVSETLATPGQALEVRVSGNRLYLADGDSGLQIIKLPPVIVGSPDSILEPNVDYVCTLRVLDPNPASLSISAWFEGIGLAASIDSAGTAIVTVPASLLSPGNFTDFLVVVGDGDLSDDVLTRGRIAHVNHAPVIRMPAISTATEDLPFSDTLSATDRDGNSVYWFVVSAPDSLRVGLTTGVITWTPRDRHYGANAISIRATDGVLNDTVTFDIPVLRVNDAPVITVVLPDTFISDQLYTLPLTATDEEYDTLHWTLLKGPEGANIIDSMLIWAPPLGMSGPETLVIRLSDGLLSDTLTREVLVVTEGTFLGRGSKIPGRLCFSASPMPFNPDVTLTIGIPESEKAPLRLTLHSLAGACVLEQSVAGPGLHRITWNGRDSMGRPMASGVYLARVNGSSGTMQKKLFLMK